MYPWIPAGALTILVGKHKMAGKTTLLMDLVSAMHYGRPFLGTVLRRFPVVWVTEQSPHTFQIQAEENHMPLLVKNDRKIAYLAKVQVMGRGWEGLVDELETFCRGERPGLIILDTWTGLAEFRGEAENHAGEAQSRLTALSRLLTWGWGVTITVHEKKASRDAGDPTVADRGRGAGALGGGVDQILSLRNPSAEIDHPIRVLQANGRFHGQGTPLKAVKIQRLTQNPVPLGGEIVGHKTGQCLWEYVEGLTHHLTHKDGYLTIQEIMALQKKGRDAVRYWIRHYHPERTGKGTKADPYRYKLGMAIAKTDGQDEGA